MSQPRLMIRRAFSGVSAEVNSSMLAPAMKPASLADLKISPLGGFFSQFVEDQAELGHHLGAQGVGRGIGGIEDGPDHARIWVTCIAFEFPVSVAAHVDSLSITW
jgi:hypothetical protein